MPTNFISIEVKKFPTSDTGCTGSRSVVAIATSLAIDLQFAGVVLGGFYSYHIPVTLDHYTDGFRRG